MASPDRKKIIIDTDCGIDDAIALLLALSSKDVADILAITCCFGNTSVDNACSNVMRVLTVCGEKNIPIYKGCSGPLIKPESDVDTVHGSDGLGNCANEFPTGDLVESDVPASVALINLAKKYPNQITLIAIAPLTNVAVAHRLDPGFTKNLKSICIMGGNYKGIGNVTEVAEFNFYCDPESANIVVSEALCPITLVPWETTMDYGIPWDLYKELVSTETKKGEFFKLVTRLHSELSEECYEAYVDCDFLATAVGLYPDCVKSSEEYCLIVEHKGTYSKGLTIVKRNSSSPKIKAEIVTDFDMDLLCKLRRKMLKTVV